MATRKELEANRQKHYCPFPDEQKRIEDGKVLDEHLKIDLSFDSSGSNPWSYRSQSQGFFVHFTAVTRDRGFESMRIPDSRSFKVCAQEAERFTAKAWTSVETFVAENLDTIREIYFAGDTKRLQAFLKTRELPPIAEEPEALPAAA